jgi:DNA-binding CsgD family transcriptional regulator
MTSPTVQNELERAREAHAQRRWSEARDSFVSADRSQPLGTDDLELLAWSAGLSGDDEGLLKTLERLYQALLDSGACLRAARAAFWLAFRLFALGEPARASGWMARSQRLVEREGRDCVEQGYLQVPIYFQSIMTRDWDAAYDAATRAAEIGERFGDADLTAFARNLQGRSLMRLGRIKQGLVLLDEAMVSAMTGELSPIFTGFIYCSAISGCHQVYALDRAREWTSALASWCASQPELVSFTGNCLVHRAEIMQLGGAWRDAIEEARRASQPPHAVEAETVAEAFYQQAEIHRLRGEFDAAEAAYAKTSQLGREPQPGLALLRVAQGRCDAAANTIRRVLVASSGTLERTRLLPAYVEIMLANGELVEARAGCQELEKVATEMGMDVVAAMAAYARGAVHLLEGEAQAALAPLRRAFAVWQQVGAPYLAARVRVLLAEACRALADDDGMALELAGARAVFETLGAAPDLARIDTLSNPPPAASHGLTARELQVLRLIATGLTNKAVAKELCLSEKTIDRHVSNIFVKIDVSTRAAATAFAYEHRLI